LVKFIKADQLFIKIDSEIMLITPTKQIIFVYNFNEKTLICFKKV